MKARKKKRKRPGLSHDEMGLGVAGGDKAPRRRDGIGGVIGASQDLDCHLASLYP